MQRQQNSFIRLICAYVQYLHLSPENTDQTLLPYSNKVLENESGRKLQSSRSQESIYYLLRELVFSFNQLSGIAGMNTSVVIRSGFRQRLILDRKDKVITGVCGQE